MSIPQGPYGRRGRDNYPAMVQSPNGFRDTYMSGNKRLNPFPTDLGGSAANSMRPLRSGIPKLAKRDGTYPGDTNMPRFGDQGSDAGYSRMNARVLYMPRWKGRDIEFNYGDYLLIVRNRPNYTSADGHHPEREDLGGRTAYSAFRIGTMALLAADWKQAHDWREGVMQRSLTEPAQPEYADYEGGRFEPELIRLEEARADDPNWATSIEEFDNNYVPLGPFVSSDIPGSGARAGGYYAKLNADPLLSCTIQGGYDVHPNVFGMTKAGGVFVGYIVKKQQGVTSGRRSGSLLSETRAPLQFIPFSSDYIPRPFIASDGTEYSAFLGNRLLWTAERDQMDRYSTRSSLKILFRPSQEVDMGPADVNREFVSLTINQANIGRRPMKFLQSRESINRESNGAIVSPDEHYSDLAYEDVEMYRDARTGQIRLMPTLETGRYIRLGYAESLEKGTGSDYLQCDLTRMLNDPANKSSLVRLGGECTARVRVGVM